MNQNARGSVGKGREGKGRRGGEGRGEERRGAPLGGVEREEFPGAFFSPFFCFFPWERSGANHLRFRVVVQLSRGGVVPPSSSPSPLPTATLNQNGIGARGSVDVVFFLFFNFLFGERSTALAVLWFVW